MLILTYKLQARKGFTKTKESKKYTMLCPVCATKQTENNLILYQINFEEAVYLCEDRQCNYPEGHDWILVKRKWLDMKKNDPPAPAASEQSATTELDQWFSELLAENEDSTSKLTDNNKKLDFGADFDFDEFEKMLMADAEKLDQESALGQKQQSKINVLSNVQVKGPQIKMSEEVEQEMSTKENSNKSDSVFPADLFEALCMDDVEICKNDKNKEEIKNLNSTQMPKEDEHKPTDESKEASKSGEDACETSESNIENNLQNKDDLAIGNNDVETLEDNETAQNDIEQPKLRRSSRIRKNVTNVVPPSKEKPTEQVRSKTVQYTNIAENAAAFKLSSEFVQKIVLQERKKNEKRELARRQCKPVVNKDVLNYIQSLPHSK